MRNIYNLLVQKNQEHRPQDSIVRGGNKGTPPLMVGLIVSLTTLSIVLHLFKIPFPLAPFLKYDLAGVPLLLLAMITLRGAIIALPVFAVGVIALGGDVVGASMKALSEAATFIPVAIIYRSFSGKLGTKTHTILAITIGTFSRVVTMVLLNYIITPYWLIWAGWADNKDVAYNITISILPYIALFNATIAIPVVIIGLASYRVMVKANVFSAK